MQSKLSTISETEKELEVSLTSEEFLPYLDKAGGVLARDMEVQGFRKGHIPRNIVEGQAGSSALYNEAAQLAVHATYEKALENSAKRGEDPRGQTPGIQGSDPDRSDPDRFSHANTKYALPEVQVTKLAPGNPFVYKVTLRAPVFELPKDYENIIKKVKESEAESDKGRIKVEEREVEDTLGWLAKQRQTKDKDIKSKNGKADEPIKLDDEFAKSLGGFKDLEALKKSIKEGLGLEKEKKEKERIRLKMIKEIIAKSRSEIPDKIIDREVLAMEEEFKQSIGQMGLEFDEYLKKIKKDKEELHLGWRGQAKERIETSLLLDEVARTENIEPEEKKIEEEVQRLLARYKNSDQAEKSMDPARLKTYVRGILKNEETFQFLENC